MIENKCREDRNESKIKLSDRKSTAAIFNNPEREVYCAIKIDGCVVNNDTSCDWALVKNGVGVIAVELKGSDITHAVEQIEATLSMLKQNGYERAKMAGLVICKRNPCFDTTIARLQLRIAKKFCAPLKVKTDGRNLNFEEILKF